MADEPTTTVRPRAVTPLRRVFVKYIDPDGRLVKLCAPAWAEGAAGRGSVLPRGWIDLGE